MLAREASVPLRVDGGLRDDVDRVIDVHGQFGRRRDRDVFAADPVVREESDRSEQGVRRDVAVEAAPLLAFRVCGVRSVVSRIFMPSAP